MTGARSFSGFGFSWTPVREKSVHPFSFLQPPFSFLQHKLGSSLNRLSVMAAPRRSVQPFPTLLSFCVGMRGRKTKSTQEGTSRATTKKKSCVKIKSTQEVLPPVYFLYGTLSVTVCH